MYTTKTPKSELYALNISSILFEDIFNSGIGSSAPQDPEKDNRKQMDGQITSSAKHLIGNSLIFSMKMILNTLPMQ